MANVCSVAHLTQISSSTLANSKVDGSEADVADKNEEDLIQLVVTMGRCEISTQVMMMIHIRTSTWGEYGMYVFAKCNSSIIREKLVVRDTVLCVCKPGMNRYTCNNNNCITCMGFLASQIFRVIGIDYPPQILIYV